MYVPPDWIPMMAGIIAVDLGFTSEDIYRPLLVPVDRLISCVETHLYSGRYPDICRRLHLAVFFGGDEQTATVHAARRAPYIHATTMDASVNQNHTVISIYGILYAMYMVRALLPRATMWCSPDPHTWVSFKSRTTFKRDTGGAEVEGDTTLEAVRFANASIEVLSWLTIVASARNVFVAVENSLNSLVFKYIPLQTALDIVGARRLVSCQGAFGARLERPLEIFTTIPDCERHLAKSRKDSRQRMKEAGDDPGRQTRATDAGVHFQPYPPAMCVVISAAVDWAFQQVEVLD